MKMPVITGDKDLAYVAKRKKCRGCMMKSR
jgi:hypothetical protein